MLSPAQRLADRAAELCLQAIPIVAVIPPASLFFLGKSQEPQSLRVVAKFWATAPYRLHAAKGCHRDRWLGD